MYTWLVLFLDSFLPAGSQLATFLPIPTGKHFAYNVSPAVRP